MENTEENRSKFFNQYHRQNLISNKGKCCLRDADFVDSLEWIELKPLSSITIQDLKAIEFSFNDESNIKINITPDNYLQHWEAIGYSRGHLALKNFDYLRLKGYALPWMGISVNKLVEWGWIKLKD